MAKKPPVKAVDHFTERGPRGPGELEEGDVICFCCALSAYLGEYGDTEEYADTSELQEFTQVLLAAIDTKSASSLIWPLNEFLEFPLKLRRHIIDDPEFKKGLKEVEEAWLKGYGVFQPRHN